MAGTPIINVSGPCKIEISANGGATFDFMGYTDNDDLPSLDTEWHNEIVESSDTGREPAAAIWTGMTAVLTFTLVKWDEAVMVELMTGPGGTAVDGSLISGVIGKEWYSDTLDFQVKITPLTVGKEGYTFPSCIMDGAALRHFDWGNAAQRKGVAVLVKREDEVGTGATKVVMSRFTVT